MSPPEQQSFPRLIAFSSPRSHKPDDPPFDGAWPPEVPREKPQWENLTCGIGCFVTALLGVVAWWLWRAMN